jgi:hypothetical protein
MPVEGRDRLCSWCDPRPVQKLRRKRGLGIFGRLAIAVAVFTVGLAAIFVLKVFWR